MVSAVILLSPAMLVRVTMYEQSLSDGVPVGVTITVDVGVGVVVGICVAVAVPVTVAVTVRVWRSSGWSFSGWAGCRCAFKPLTGAAKNKTASVSKVVRLAAIHRFTG